MNSSWRQEINRMINKICVKMKDYSKPRMDTYSLLIQKSSCDLQKMFNEFKKKEIERGQSQKQVEKYNYLDLIEEDPKLREFYTEIVRKMYSKYDD